MSIVTIEHLTHTFGDKPLFQGVSFRINRGEHAGLVGSNGSGKSTLLRMMAGDYTPDAGTIEWLPGIRFGFLRQHAELRTGLTMKQVLREAFSQLYKIEDQMQQLAESFSKETVQLEEKLAKFGEMQHTLERSGFYELDAKIEEVAAGLGLHEIGLERDVATLSGGQRTKLLLGRLLLEKSDVLLLDEPTNYLDETHIDWLAAYLRKLENAYVVISHDETFLNEVTGTIFHLEHRQIKRYSGSFRAFRAMYEQSRQLTEAAYERQRHEIERLEGFIQKNRIRKAKQAKSREKRLEKMEIIERPNALSKPRFDFPAIVEPVPKVMTASDLRIGYSEPLFAARQLQINRGDKIAITGSNGIGKTTMLRTLLGLLPPLGGTVRLGERVEVGYYAQEDTASGLAPLDMLCALRLDLTQKDIRKTLAIAGLKEEHIRRPMRTLSGGEQAKVRLAELMLGKSNVLVLDEPTNHLDVPAKEALSEALASYKGTILLVSHEPAFYEKWVTHVWRADDWR
ncbi:ABC-F family ATP-binding cassette domain-containing protein [Paenibacillus sp. NPDC058071]|uniref:ABC-F family ATP-binding cassette domain-containing protein n=1 Tax=Paenibacillus sp. NPDC058071 TaxID=3346326 RepID=UPI0036DA2552